MIIKNIEPGEERGAPLLVVTECGERLRICKVSGTQLEPGRRLVRDTQTSALVVQDRDSNTLGYAHLASASTVVAT